MLADILGYNAKTPTQVGSLKVDIVKSFEYQYNQDVTSHPVETGFEIQDHIVNKPLQLTMTVGISSSPVTWYWQNGTGQTKFADGLKALEQIRNNKEPVTIIRPEKKYDDMVLTSCRVTKQDDSKSVIYADLSFTQIVKVTVQTTQIPEDIVAASKEEDVGETAANAGSASTTDAGSLDSSTSGAGTGDSIDGTSETAKNQSWAAGGVDLVKDTRTNIIGG